MCALAPCASAGKSFYCDQSRSQGGVNSEQRLPERKNRTPRTAQLNPPTVTLIWELPKLPHKTPLYMQLQPPCASPAIAKKGHKIGGKSGLEPGTSWFRAEHSAVTPHDPTNTAVVKANSLRQAPMCRSSSR
ncbi:hypothetical protein Bbelb_417630 [Branchiostoma belcheri]|nr:hypothetical protein Bbelb_417630 [Branchiostoma belcheri]